MLHRWLTSQGQGGQHAATDRHSQRSPATSCDCQWTVGERCSGLSTTPAHASHPKRVKEENGGCQPVSQPASHSPACVDREGERVGRIRRTRRPRDSTPVKMSQTPSSAVRRRRVSLQRGQCYWSGVVTICSSQHERLKGFTHALTPSCAHALCELSVCAHARLSYPTALGLGCKQQAVLPYKKKV